MTYALVNPNGTSDGPHSNIMPTAIPEGMRVSMIERYYTDTYLGAGFTVTCYPGAEASVRADYYSDRLSYLVVVVAEDIDAFKQTVAAVQKMLGFVTVQSEDQIVPLTPKSAAAPKREDEDAGEWILLGNQSDSASANDEEEE